MGVEKFFEVFLQAVPYPVITIGEDLRIGRINEQACDFLKITRPDLLGAPVTEKLPTLKRYEDTLKNLIASNQAFQITRARHSSAGSDVFFNLSAFYFPLLPDGYILQLEDATRQVESELQMLRAEKTESLNGLAAGISHELNNPLSAIITGAQNIRRRLEPSRQANADIAAAMGIDLQEVNNYLNKRDIPYFLDSIGEGARGASRVLVEMLESDTSSQTQKDNINIKGLINNLLRHLEQENGLRDPDAFADLKIEQHYDEDLPNINTSAPDLTRVLENLLRNAQQAILERASASKSRGLIVIECHRGLNEFTIDITDNGVGMNETVLRRIFDPYFTTRQQQGGHGLGLSMVYRIITGVLQGEINVRSKPGVGTRFTLTLPI